MTKSLKGKSFADSSTTCGISLPFMPATKSLTGIEEIKIFPSYSTVCPFSMQQTLFTILFSGLCTSLFSWLCTPLLSLLCAPLLSVLPPSSVLIVVTLLLKTMVPPISSISLATISHNWPGPYLGYMYSSINEVSTFLFFPLGIILLNTSFKTADIESPFTLCAPQSAEISLGCRPQSFSV